MELDNITQAYELINIKVNSDQLLLDPNNPRLITDALEEKSYSYKEILSEEVQMYVLSRVCKNEYHVLRLIEGIRNTGFLSGMHEIIVKEIPNEDKYIVIEGNRRTAAIKHLLGQNQHLTLPVRETLDRSFQRHSEYFF